MPISTTNILYFHGGGLFTGHKDDFPQVYQDKLHDLGFSLIGFNYPLAPEASLDKIIDECTNFVKQYSDTDYLLMGRSAGSFLALQVLEELYLAQENLPAKVILFYGYENFNNPQFYEKLEYPVAIQYQQIESFITQKTNQDPLYHRALLYLYARQEGLWPKLIKDHNDYKNRQLSILDSARMPPTFIAHSAHDKDVPYSESKKLNQRITDSTFKTVYYMDHEFDLQINNEQTISVMNALWSWLKT